MLQSCRLLLLGSLLSALALGFGYLPSSLAQGGPPMLTDDPGTPGSGVWEINTAYLEQRTTEERVRSFPHVDFNYGLGEHVQLKLRWPHRRHVLGWKLHRLHRRQKVRRSPWLYVTS